MTLFVRTDKPDAELYLYDDRMLVASTQWLAHRSLAETIHVQISELFKKADCIFADLTGIVTYVGPGSFTGLRIGLSVTNALAYALNINAAGTTGDKWIDLGFEEIAKHPGPVVVMPEYGAEANITQPRK